MKSIGETLKLDTSALFLSIRKAQPEKFSENSLESRVFDSLAALARAGDQVGGRPLTSAGSKSERWCRASRHSRAFVRLMRAAETTWLHDIISSASGSVVSCGYSAVLNNKIDDSLKAMAA